MMRGFAFDGLFKGTSEAHKRDCECGCVPNVMSLHEAAKERARRRAEAQADGKTVLPKTAAAAVAAALAATPPPEVPRQPPPS
jgi:hypothetical protein